MALTVSGDIRYTTATCDVLTGNGWNKYAFGGWVRVNFGSGTNNLASFCSDNNTAATVGFSAATTLFSSVVGTGVGQNVVNNSNYSAGNTYHFLHIFDSGLSTTTSYWNGIRVSNSTAINLPWGLRTNQGRVVIGLNPLTTSYNTSVTLEDFAIWSGYAPNLADVVDLMGRNKTPLQIGNGAFIWYTLDGVSGVAPTPGSSGMLNWGTGGSGKYSLNSTTFWGTPSGNGLFTSEQLTHSLTVNVDQYINQNSGLATFVFRKVSDNSLSFNPVININPSITITVTGNNTFVQLTGAVTYSVASYVMYDLGSNRVPSNATVTYNMQPGWAQTADGFVTSATGNMGNYAGGNLWSLPSSTTCEWGFNLNSTPDWNLKNWFRKISANFTNAASSTSDGYPLQFAGNTGTATVWTNSFSNSVDSRGQPIPTGLWFLDYKDHPTFSSSLWMTSSSAAAFGFVTQPSLSYSTVMSGVRYTRNAYLATTGTSFGGGLILNWVPFSPTGINVSNIWLIAPNNSLDTSDPYAIDQNVITYFSTSGQKFSPIVRVMGLIHGGGGDCSITQESDFLNPTGFQWIQPAQTIQALYVRPYNLTISPSAFVPWLGWVYPSSINYMYDSAGSTNVRYTYEVITSGNHGLRSGNVLNPTNVGFGPINVSGVDGYVYSVTKFTTQQSCIITSPSSFVMVEFQLVISSGANIKTPTTTTYATGLYYTYNKPGPGLIKPWEAIFKVPASISGATAWFSAPAFADDYAHAAIARTAFNTLPSGRKVIVEYSNEVWNGLFRQSGWMFSVASMLGLTSDQLQTIRGSQIHDIWDSVFSSGGRPNSITRVFANQYGSNMAGLTNMMNTLLSRNLPAHALSFAPYVDFTISDVSVTGAMGSWDYDKLHDFYRHHLFYNSRESILFGAATGLTTTYQNITGTGLSLFAYEAANEVPFYYDIPQASIKAIDWYYHRENYNTRNAYYLYNQLHGLNKGCYFSLYNYFSTAGVTSSATVIWGTMRWPGQQWGVGENNRFAINDGVAHDVDNVSPAMLAWKQWNDRTTTIPVIPNLPTVISQIPTSGTASVTGILPLSVTFNKAIVPGTVGFSLYDGNNNIVPTTFSVNNFTATLTPTGNLSAGIMYTLRVSGLQDLVGLSQASTFTYSLNQSSAFAVSALLPANSSTNNSILSTVSVTFNAPIQTGTLTFVLRDINGNIIPGTVQFS